MGINLIESKRGEQIFEYKFPDFFNENNQIGDSADDFEVLQVLGNGTFGNVLKVKSKKNLEIYAMKKVNKNLLKGKNEEKYYRNEQIILSKLQSPLVCRCYTYFEDKNFMYYVMEFVNNGDLKSYFFANKSTIPEEKLWDLFFKCISGLLYIHNLGIIHRDIKLDNLFLDDNFNIKIGDFNISAALNTESAKNFTHDSSQINQMLNGNSVVGTPGFAAPEVAEKQPYDQKADVYSMGISFFILAYGASPYEKKGLNNKLNSSYSDEINDIIERMIEKDVTKRYSSNEAYKAIKNIYMEKYVKNSSVKSALNCFYSFKNFRDFFLNNTNKKILLQNKEFNNNFSNDNKVKMGYSVFDSIQTLRGYNEFQINSNLFDLRRNMENYGLNIKYNEEIQIGKFIFYFLKILNSILNEVVIDENDTKKIKEIDKELAYLSPSYWFENGQENILFNKIMEVYNKRILSLISRNFINIIKTKKKCMFCINERNYFSMINYIPFNVSILTKNSNNNNLHIINGFEYLLNDEKSFNEQKGIICPNCKKVNVHKEYKSFYYTANNLIIILNRGENCENKAYIDFDENLDLLNKKYQLVGIIELKDDGEYVSFTRNENNQWCYNGIEENQMPFEALKGVGTLVSLFYYYNNGNMPIQSNSSYAQQQINNLSLSENNVNINPNNSIYNNFSNTNFNGSNPNNFSNNVNNLNMNNGTNINSMNNICQSNMNNGTNINSMNNMGQLNMNNGANINSMNNMGQSNMNNGANINSMNNMGQSNINYQFPSNNINNNNQFVIQNNFNFFNNNNNFNFYNVQGPNLTGQMNINYNNNNIQMNNFQGGNSTNVNNNFYNM